MGSLAVGDFVKHKKSDYQVFRVIGGGEPDGLYRCISAQDESRLPVYHEGDLYRVEPTGCHSEGNPLATTMEQAPKGWMTAEELTLQLLEDRQVQMFTQALGSDRSEKVLLCRALVSVAYLLQDHAGEPAKRYLTHLLTSFPPLVGMFDDNGFAEIFEGEHEGDSRIRRLVSPSGVCTLLMHRDFWDRELKSYIGETEP